MYVHIYIWPRLLSTVDNGVNRSSDSSLINSFSASADRLVPVLPAGGLLWKEERKTCYQTCYQTSAYG